MSDVCACGCGRPTRPGSKYADYERCKQRAYRRRLAAAAKAAGVPSHLSLKTLQSAGAGVGDASQRRRTPSRRAVSVRLSYRKAVEAVAAELRDLRDYDDHATGDGRVLAEAILKPLLSDKARRALERVDG